MINYNIVKRLKFSPLNNAYKKEALRSYLLHLFAIIGLIYLIATCSYAVSQEKNILAILLFVGIVIMSINLYIFIKSNNTERSSVILVYYYFVLMLFLLVTGGIDKSGILWLPVLPLLTFFLLGFKKGIFVLILFSIAISIILFYPNNQLLVVEYSNEYKLRIFFSFLVINILSALYEYSHDIMMKNRDQLQENLEKVLETDRLTQVYNRYGYEKIIEKKLLTSSQTSGSLLMCDIDFFKKINDTYGHNAGDKVLRDVAKSMTDTIRDNDVSIRWGGEEFLICLFDCEIEDAYKISEKIRKLIASNPIVYEDNVEIHVTISMGLAYFKTLETIDTAIKTADKALYKSKFNGKNKTTI